MKRAAACMLALAGCNWVFGLDATTELPGPPDSPPPIDGPPIRLHLALLQATLDATQTPQSPIEAPIPDLMLVEAARIDGGAPMTLTPQPDGTVEVPLDIAATPGWRFSYQRQNGIIHEYQDPPDGAHIIEPWLGPLARTAPAAGTGYTITPTSYVGSHNTNQVFTLGTWTVGKMFLPPAGATFDYDYQGATSFSGPLGKPAATDRGILVDYQSDASQCRYASGSVDFAAGDIGPPRAAVTGAWIGTVATTTFNISLAQVSTTETRPLNETALAARLIYGYLPNTAMPVFTQAPDSNRAVLLPNPPLVDVLSCALPTPGGQSIPPFHEPVFARTKLPHAAYVEIAASRPVSGVGSVINGLAMVSAANGTGGYDFAANVAFAANVVLTTSTGTALDLFKQSDNDGLALSSRDGVLTLTWDKSIPTRSADYWDVTLLEAQSGGLAPKRVYTTPTRSVKIDGALLQPHTQYVVQLTAYAGRAGAASGDYRNISAAQQMSIINAHSFTTP